MAMMARGAVSVAERPTTSWPATTTPGQGRRCAYSLARPHSHALPALTCTQGAAAESCPRGEQAPHKDEGERGGEVGGVATGTMRDMNAGPSHGPYPYCTAEHITPRPNPESRPAMEKSTKCPAITAPAATATPPAAKSSWSVPVQPYRRLALLNRALTNTSVCFVCLSLPATDPVPVAALGPLNKLAAKKEECSEEDLVETYHMLGMD